MLKWLLLGTTIRTGKAAIKRGFVRQFCYLEVLLIFFVCFVFCIEIGLCSDVVLPGKALEQDLS